MRLPKIFDDFDKHFKNWFEEWDEFDKEFDSLLNNASEDDKKYHFESQYQNFYDSSDKNKNYSMSYRYETGMEEPVIRIEGDVDDETINRFVKGIEHRFQTRLDKGKTTKFKRLGEKKDKKKQKDKQKSDKEEKKEVSYSLEMPGIGKNQISTEINGRILKISGKKDNLNYTKRIVLPFEPKKKIEITADNGLIHITAKRK